MFRAPDRHAAFALTLHPWYVCWIVPFAAVRVREPGGSAAWLWLTLAAPLLYWVAAGWQLEGPWQEPIWLWPALALPFFALALRGALLRAAAERARLEALA